MSDRSTSVAQAIDRVRQSLGSVGVIGNYHYQAIANGPVEQVLAFNNDESIQLVQEADNSLHFSSRGVLTDLQRNEIPGSAVETTFPVDPAQFSETEKWPPEQKEPWTGPPLDTKHTANGYSKQAYFFNDRRDYLVTVGPSVPKITRLKSGGAQFWVASIGAITQGGGKYRGVHGMSVYIGSAYLSDWPKEPQKQIELLKVKFHARIGTYFKFVLP